METESWPQCDLCNEPVDPANSITWKNKVENGRHWFHWECFGDWGRAKRDRQLQDLADE